METVEKIMGNLGAADIDARLEEQLIDGILYAFQEQTTEDVVMLNGFGTIVNSLSKRVKPYLPQICGTILWRLNNKSAKVMLRNFIVKSTFTNILDFQFYINKYTCDVEFNEQGFYFQT